MGTMIQRHEFGEADFRGERFKDHAKDLRGNNDLLTLTQPKAIKDIHLAYLEAGADIIETNTFSSTTIAQADYGLEHLAFELNREGARLAREAADEVAKKTGVRRVSSPGRIGPTNRTASISPDVSNPGFRAVDVRRFARRLSRSGAGPHRRRRRHLLVETVFDTLNAKAALYALEDAFDEVGTRFPIMISGTITDLSGRTLSGQTLARLLEFARPRQAFFDRLQLRARRTRNAPAHRRHRPHRRYARLRLPQRRPAQ